MLSWGPQDLETVWLVIWVELVGKRVWPVLGWVLGSQARNHPLPSSVSKLDVAYCRGSEGGFLSDNQSMHILLTFHCFIGHKL